MILICILLTTIEVGHLDHWDVLLRKVAHVGAWGHEFRPHVVC